MGLATAKGNGQSSWLIRLEAAPPFAAGQLNEATTATTTPMQLKAQQRLLNEFRIHFVVPKTKLIELAAALIA